MGALGPGRRAARAAALTLLLFALLLVTPRARAEDAAPIRLGLLMVKTGPADMPWKDLGVDIVANLF